MWKWYVIAAVACLVVAGFAFERLSRFFDARELPPPGRRVDVGGRALHLLGIGERGPTLVILTGANNSTADWELVLPKLAELSRAHVYDRAGYGWSDASDGAHDSDAAVADLEALLQRAELPAPYLLVAHSAGGLVATRFAERHRGELVGLVLVDALEEDDLAPDAPPELRDGFGSATRMMGALAASAHLGIPRLLAALELLPKPALVRLARYPARARRACLTLAMHRPALEAGALEMAALQSQERRALAPGALGAFPLVVLRAERFDRRPPGISDEASARIERHLLASQQKLAALSSNSVLLTAEGSGHAVNTEAPEAVVDAVRRALAMIEARTREGDTPWKTWSAD